MDTTARQHIQDLGDVAVWRPRGTLESLNVTGFREELASFCGCERVVFDLSEVTFMDSSGLGALIGGVRRVREYGGRVAVCSPRRPIARLLQVVGLDRLVTVQPSLEEAVAGLGPSALTTVA